MSRLVVKVLLVAGCCVGAPRVEAAQADAIAKAIRQLGDDRYQVREKATKYLWRQGPSAEAALKEAAGSDDPEIASRAKAILRDIRDGIPPDAPPETAATMRQYLRGADDDRDRILLKLLKQGPRGWDAALSLVRRAGARGHRPKLKPVLLALATEHIVDGDTETAARMLEVAALTSDGEARRHFAAFLLVGGGLEETIRQYAARTAKAPPPAEAKVLVYLYRAAGDRTRAVGAARAAKDDRLLDEILCESGRWGELARRTARAVAAAENDDDKLTTTRAMWATYHRLAGDAKRCDEILTQMQGRLASAEAVSDEAAQQLVEAMLINGRLDRARAVLERAPGPLVSAEILAAQNRHDAALEHLAAVKPTSKEQALAIRAARIRFCRILGRRAEAERLFLERMATLEDYRKQKKLVEGLYPFRTSRALAWWGVLRREYYNEGDAAGLRRLRAVLAHRGEKRDLGRLYPTGLLMQGRAMQRAGQDEKGRKRMRTGYLLAMGNNRDRLNLSFSLLEVGLVSQAVREYQRILRTGAFVGEEALTALRATAIYAAQGAERLRLRERARLMAFRQRQLAKKPAACLADLSAAGIARAESHLSAGRIGEAVAQARLCYSRLPQCGVWLGDFVVKLERRGAKREADALFRQLYADSVALSKRYPASAEFHSQVASLAALRKHEPARALVHATRAAQLGLGCPVYLAALAEVHFARGERKKAVEQIEKAIRIYPWSAGYHQQLARYRASAT